MFDNDHHSSVRSRVYRFDDFCLNPLTRELSRNGEHVVLAASGFDCLVYLIEHRARFVGRDELISAVWGRTDVTYNLLAQTIVRLRRTLGDGGNAQRCIKTMPRIGYRWMLDTTVEFQTSTVASVGRLSVEDDVHSIQPSHDDGVANRPPRVKPMWAAFMMVSLLMLALAGTYLTWSLYHHKPPSPAVHFDQNTTVVLPVEVKAPPDWAWLHLGLMELIAGQLRQANVPTESSQDVLNLLRQNNQSDLSSFALIVHADAVLEDETWRVHLGAKSKEGRTWQAEASSKDVLAAARDASSLLLVEWGMNGESRRVTVGGSREEYLLRISAEELAGQPKIAHDLIDKAPADLRHTPELTFAEAQVECDEGNITLCGQTLSGLLKDLSPKEQPLLRAKVLTNSWFVYYRNHQLAEGISALNEALKLLRGQKDTKALADAYLDRSHLEYYENDLDDAAADLGLARVNYTLAGDSEGQAKSDFWLGVIANDRGQFDQAIPLMEHAYEQYRRIGLTAFIITPLETLSYARHLNLQFPDELATTDRYWPFDQKHMAFPNAASQHVLTEMRAIALADNGRASEANRLLEHLVGELDSHNEAAIVANVNALLANVALQRGDTQVALSWISKAMAGHGFDDDNDKRRVAEAWLINVDVLAHAGKVEELNHAVAAMETWAVQLPRKDDWIDAWLLRAKATQSWSEGKSDQALDQFRAAMAAAEKLGVPEFIVGTGVPYAQMLLKTGHVDEAVAIGGRLSTWDGVDWRAAWVEADVYKALGQTVASDVSYAKAQRLAGDRMLPARLE